MKYIRIRSMGFIIFEDHIPHITMQAMLDPDDELGVVSAGFVSCGSDGISCFGKSESLGVETTYGTESDLRRKI